ELTRNPLGLARALEKIESAVAPTQSINRGSAHLCIADPLGRRVNLREGFWSDLFASHPPMPARIAALREVAFQKSAREPPRRGAASPPRPPRPRRRRGSAAPVP